MLLVLLGAGFATGFILLGVGVRKERAQVVVEVLQGGPVLCTQGAPGLLNAAGLRGRLAVKQRLGERLRSIGQQLGDDTVEVLQGLFDLALVGLVGINARIAVVAVQAVPQGVEGVPKAGTDIRLLVTVRDRAFGNAAFGLLHGCFAQFCILLRKDSEAAHRQPGDLALLDGLPQIVVCDLDGHQPCALLDVGTADVGVRFCNPALHDSGAISRHEIVLEIDAVPILRKPVRGLCDLVRCHVIAVGVLDHRLVHNACDKMGLRVRLDDLAVGGEGCFPFLVLDDQELPLVRRLVNQGHKRDSCISDFLCLFYFSRHVFTSFQGFRQYKKQRRRCSLSSIRFCRVFGRFLQHRRNGNVHKRVAQNGLDLGQIGAG